MVMDLSYLEALMGGAAPEGEAGGETGGVWVVGLEGSVSDGMLRLVGKARVIADALGAYAYLLLAGGADAEAGERAIKAGADTVLLASGVPALADLVGFFQDRKPQAVLFPRTALGRVLGPGLAQVLGGGLCGNAAELEVDPIYQRIVAHQPVLDGAARQRMAIVTAPAVVVVDTSGLPAAFNEPWRSGKVEDAGVNWTAPAISLPAELPKIPVTLANAPVVVAAGLGLRTAEGFSLAERVAQALGGVVAGEIGALDAGWIAETQLVGLTGVQVAPKLVLALGVDGDTSFFMSTKDAGLIVAVQPDPEAPIVPVADYNIIANPAEFAEALLAELAR